MLPYLTVRSVSSKQSAPPLSSVVVWVGNQNNIMLTCTKATEHEEILFVTGQELSNTERPFRYVVTTVCWK